MTSSKSVDQLHRELLFAQFEFYRAAKDQPEHAAKVEATTEYVRLAGASYAHGGLVNLKDFLDAFEDDYGLLAATWLHRRWAGLLLPDGSYFL